MMLSQFSDDSLLPKLRRGSSMGGGDNISLAESLMMQEPPSLADRLYKIKSRHSTCPDIGMLPTGGLVTVDQHNCSVKLFNKDGDYERTLVRGVRPLSVATNRSGMIFFTDHIYKKSKFVQVYSMDGSFITKWGEDIRWKPRGLAISNKGLIVIGDASESSQCVALYTQDGKQLVKFGSKGSNLAQFNNPYYIAVDLYDRILVSDYGNHSVKIWDDRGTFIGSVGKKGSGDGELLYPRGVTADGNGNLYVADTGNRRVSLFSAEGRFIEHILTADDGLRFPHGIAYSRKEHRLAVSQHTSAEKGSFHKIRVYQIDMHKDE